MIEKSESIPSSFGACAGPTNPFSEFPRQAIEQSVPDRFEQQVARYPDRIAVKTKDCSLSYSELNNAANRVAWAILSERGQTQEPTALLFDNGASFVTASMGAMKAAKIQVPLESTFPKARQRYILEQSDARVVLTDSANLALARELSSLPVINIDDLDGAFSTAAPGLHLPPDANVAIAYTSGSTGEPKGILWNHRVMLHAVMRHTNRYHICATDRIVMFRATPRPALYPLLNGATYYPVSLPAIDPEELADWLMREEITIYRAAVSVFRSFAGTLTGKDAFPHLRLVLLFGEAILHPDVELYRKHFADDTILGGSLGCNEFDDFACSFIDKKASLPRSAIPGGYPIGDTEVLIVDEHGRQLGVDQIGEIVIRSRYNALGYWRRPDLTAAAFVPDPDGRGECCYRTGDLGRRGADGCLFHHGRKDFQIKIRGHRVDVSEVETALLEIEGVREAAVAGKERSPGERSLVGYVVWTGSQPPRISELRRQLRAKLPDYMIPSTFLMLDTLPLTATGKVDRRALPAADGTRPPLDIAFVAPRTKMEERLAAIWAEVLGLDRVGVHDAFLELGGNSLLAMQVASHVLAQLGVTLPLRALLDAATVEEMAARIGEEPIESRELHEVRPIVRDTEKRALVQAGIAMHPNDLWAITSYFNPLGHARRLENYRAFRKHLAVPLVTVELSFNGQFELRREDADILVQISGSHVMWQKERLLNIAIGRVPDACDKIAWLDCDIIFDGNEWKEEAVRALDEFSLVHLFRERHDLERDTQPDQLRRWSIAPTSESVIYRIEKKEAAPEDLSSANAPLERHTTTGLAWASRREVLVKHGLYDACVLGSGDRAILCAALGEFDYGARALLMNSRRAQHYRLWATQYYETVRGRVGYIDGRLFHLWHGELEDRQYATRHHAFERFDFDPFTDIAMAHNGCWRWNSNKAELHAFLSTYFESRREGG